MNFMVIIGMEIQTNINTIFYTTNLGRVLYILYCQTYRNKKEDKYVFFFIFMKYNFKIQSYQDSYKFIFKYTLFFTIFLYNQSLQSVIHTLLFSSFIMYFLFLQFCLSNYPIFSSGVSTPNSLIYLINKYLYLLTSSSHFSLIFSSFKIFFVFL